MGSRILYLGVCALLVAGTACVPGADPLPQIADNGAGDANTPDKVDNAASRGQQDGASANADQQRFALSGALSATGEYQLFELRNASAGEDWRVQLDSANANACFLVVLFNDRQELLYRQALSAYAPFYHVLRQDTARLTVGVTPLTARSGGSFQITAERTGVLGVPAPRSQIVYLNFGPGHGVTVHGRTGIDFAAFDSGTLGNAYAGATATFRSAIVRILRADYANYNVVVTSSDEGPPPGDPHETLNFGGNDDRLLGLADNVDQYNVDPAQTAVIYTEAFADYAVMALTVDEMRQMIGNTASHELGHLLGLYHTAAPADVMDTTGSAWDLTENQSFTTAKLEPSVFPCGFENSPERLAQTVGYNPAPKKAVAAKAPLAQDAVRKTALRALVQTDLRTRCGTCLELDGSHAEDVRGTSGE